MTQTVSTVAALRETLAALKPARIGMVPTMGALHDGHVSLVTEAQQHCDHVVVSIFVNPTQFAPNEDFDAYPRTLESDLEKLAGKAAIIFAPSPREMYPPGFATTVTMAGPARGLESDFRPHFFSGVATVVAKLLLAATPDVAVFGEKDYQQLMVVKQLARDLMLPTRIIGAPTRRAADGLAMSSRNAYLDPRERKIAGQMNLVLKDVALHAAREGIDAAEAAGTQALLAAGFDTVDYVAIRDSETLELVTTLARPARVLAAARVGKTRLIDNMQA